MSAPGQQPAPAPAPAAGTHWSWWLVGATVVALGLVVVVVLLWPATAWWVEHVDGIDLEEKVPKTGQEILSGKDRQEVLDKARGPYHRGGHRNPGSGRDLLHRLPTTSSSTPCSAAANFTDLQSGGLLVSTKPATSTGRPPNPDGRPVLLEVRRSTR
ncbi:hypothetical protein [Actinomadura rudentiformis]|uniref:Uncharacterized protein n=1 Tax=Actinomadura rudentiformis TaxID=359158 RepID=A0A6H9YSE7_9ACTN|nr:hypothetical protein [Actinomadura rudentiformis]KAB2346928.1 hypothetical protein F8566_22305 [Actinomadura rudentiformis]